MVLSHTEMFNGLVMVEANDLGAQIADYVSAGPSAEAGSDSPYSDM